MVEAIDREPLFTKARSDYDAVWLTGHCTAAAIRTHARVLPYRLSSHAHSDCLGSSEALPTRPPDDARQHARHARTAPDRVFAATTPADISTRPSYPS